VIGNAPSVADISMVGYLLFPKHESGYDLAASHPAMHAWLGRVSALPGWRAPYGLLPGQHMRCYVT
jgi:glutathione S-transferase